MCRKKFISIFLVLGFLLTISSAWATEYHVSISGNDTKGKGSKGKPWRTIAYALSKIKGGDIITIHEGTYYEYNLQVRSLGTDGSPTIIRSASGESVTVDGMQDKFSKFYVITIKAANYVTISGLRITGGGIGGNIHIGYSRQPCTYISIENCEIWNGGKGLGPKNPSIIRFNHTKHCSIKNCKIFGYGPENTDRSGIKIWRGTSFLTIDHNEVFGLGGKGIDNKHGGPNKYLTLTNNYVHDIGSHGINLNGDHSKVENNLIINCKGSALCVWRESGGPGGSYSLINHNTFVNSGSVSLGTTGTSKLTSCKFTNNLIINCGGRNLPGLTITPYRKVPYDHKHIIDYNCYYNSRYEEVVRDRDDVLYTLPDWQKISGQDMHSAQANPDFIKLSRKYSPVCNYRVSQTSAAYRSASDGKDMGADVNLVFGGPCPQRTPVNLTIKTVQ